MNFSPVVTGKKSVNFQGPATCSFDFEGARFSFECSDELALNCADTCYSLSFASEVDRGVDLELGSVRFRLADLAYL